jgi:hypothetical protein
LDNLKPVSATQDFGTLQSNKNVMGKSIQLNNRKFDRGLGTHANARIVYDIAGQGFKHFQTWVGSDAGNPASTVSFGIKVDGEQRYDSGVMATLHPPRLVDIDVTGAKTLELLVGDGGNGIGGDHANFADAKLLR